MDKGVDTGPILFQREVIFSENENTFAKTYQKLLSEIERLFLDKIDDILNCDWVLYPQNEEFAAFHKVKDLPDGINWDDDIAETMLRIFRL